MPLDAVVATEVLDEHAFLIRLDTDP